MQKAPGEVSLGTTIFACIYKDGVLLAADSRSSAGSYVANRYANKITKINDHIFTCRSGSSADTQALTDALTMYMDHLTIESGKPVSVRAAASVLSKVAYNNREHMSAGLICAGIDETGPHVYSVPVGGNLIEQAYTIGGSGSVFIYGLCNEHYRPDFTKEEAMKFARMAVSHAIHMDGSSGGIIRMVAISQDESGRVISERYALHPEEHHSIVW